MTEGEVSARTAWMTLGFIPGLGAAGVKRLVAAAGSACRAVQAEPALWEQVLGSLQAARCRRALPQAVARAARQEAAARRYGAALVTRADDDYPQLLGEIADAPATLFAAGRLCADAACVAIVGPRRASAYGQEVAHRLGGDLAARGVTVVSGMAYGIDAAAHRGALEAGGRTIAVLGCGVDVVYPRGHVRLHREIRRQGAVVSEFPMGSSPQAGSFPRRNRLISGLSTGVVVVEAPARSGSLITARCAGEQGRQVYAVPGSILTGRNAGSHALLRDGAVLVRNAEEVLAELPQWGLHVSPPQPEGRDGSLMPNADADARRLLKHLGADPAPVDALVVATGLGAGDLLGMLLELELDGQVRQYPGQRFARVRRPVSGARLSS